MSFLLSYMKLTVIGVNQGTKREKTVGIINEYFNLRLYYEDSSINNFLFKLLLSERIISL